MLINEVEHIVGLSKKSIRYYEEIGLLTPKRNQDNDYRIYQDMDIKKLKTIKFLRELGVPIGELKALNEKKLSLSECMKDRMKKIEKEKENYQKVITMCNAIIDSNETYEDIDINTYFEGMNRLRKEGFILKEVKTSKMKKILGAIVSSCVFSFLFLCLIGIISYFQLVESEKIPWVVYGIILLILFIPVFGMGKNLVSRIIEINKGEEDEASKY